MGMLSVHLPSKHLRHLSCILIRSISTQENLSSNHILCDPSMEQSYRQLSQKFYEAMKACASVRSKPVARKFHGQLVSIGLNTAIFLQNHLLHMYSRCSLIDDARRVFCSIQHPTVFSWNTMIYGWVDLGHMREAEKLFNEMPKREVSWTTVMSGHYHNGQARNAIKLFVSMVQNGDSLYDPFSFSCVMEACRSLGYIHLALQLQSTGETKFWRQHDSSKFGN